MKTRPKMLGQLLLESGVVAAALLEEALGPRRRSGERLGETLVRLGSVSPTDVGKALAVQLGLPFHDRPLRVEDEAVGIVQGDLLRAHAILPLSVRGRSMTAAMADPLDLAAMDDLQFQSGRRVQPVVATPGAVEEGIDAHYGVRLDDLVDALPEELRRDRAPGEEELQLATRSAPVVRLVDHVIRSAIDEGASDIHVEETGADVRIRLRIDGRLRPSVDLPHASRRAVLSRLKVISGMDVSVRRRPQDGRVRMEHRGRKLTLRVNTLPVNGGEKAVVRILDGQAAPRSLSSLGIASHDLLMLRRLVARGEGVVLATGPTGSGKSTTLFAALSEIDRRTRNVVTLEDPVEYDLAGANQVQVDARAGLSFADALRAVLRQDPDVVMVGEIRDRETAEIAMAAAVTGHLVLSTLHTMDAPGAITRLLNMGVPPFLVAGGLSGVVAQRLVRRRCIVCHGRGCDLCDEGCRGRTGVYQVLAVTDSIRDEICRDAASARIRQLAREAGMGTLGADTRRAILSGLTTPHEGAHLLLTEDGVASCSRCGATIPTSGIACPYCGHRHGSVCACGERLEPRWRFCPWCVEEIAV